MTIATRLHTGLALAASLALLVGLVLCGCPSQTSGDDDDDAISDDDTSGGDDDAALVCEVEEFHGPWGGDLTIEGAGTECVQMALVPDGNTIAGSFAEKEYFDNCVFLDACTAQCDLFTTDPHPDCVDFHLVAEMVLEPGGDELDFSFEGFACSEDHERGEGLLIRKHSCID